MYVRIANELIDDPTEEDDLSFVSEPRESKDYFIDLPAYNPQNSNAGSNTTNISK
jgi:hypothetical protein